MSFQSCKTSLLFSLSGYGPCPTQSKTILSGGKSVKCFFECSSSQHVATCNHQQKSLMHTEFNIWILRLKTTIKLSQVDACINGILLLKLFNKLQQQQDGKFAILRGIMSCYSMQSSHCCHTVTNNSFSFKFNNRKQRSHCLNDTSLFCHKRWSSS